MNDVIDWEIDTQPEKGYTHLKAGLSKAIL